jgi:hypothetical protein
MIDSRVIPTVMAWLGHAIYAFAACIKDRRGWPAFAGHDGLSGRWVNHWSGWYYSRSSGMTHSGFSPRATRWTLSKPFRNRAD